MNPIAKEYYSTVSKGRWNTEKAKAEFSKC
jgi:hypothetical protein